MANDLYTRSFDVIPGNRVGSQLVENEFAMVQTGLEKLPSLPQSWSGSANYAVAGGTVNVYTATVAATQLTSYTDGLSIIVKFGTPNNNTTPTINLNALGAKTIERADGTALASGELVGICQITYNATSGRFQLTSVSALNSVAAAAASAAQSASIISGFLSNSPVTSSGGLWTDDAPAGKLYRFADRLFVGDAATEGSGIRSPGVAKSWVGYSAGGYMTYFECRSTLASFSQFGGIGIAGATRSSDNTLSGEDNSIGGAFYAHNNNTNAADKKAAWAIYGHAAQTADNEFTTALELDTCSTRALVGVSPFVMGATGSTATAWFGVGGETAQQLQDGGQGATLANVSCAIGIVNTAAGAANNRYAKGIVFQANSLSGTDGLGTGQAVAMEMASGQQLQWAYSGGAGALGGVIRSDGLSATNQQRLIFTSSGLEVRGVQSDLTTERTLFVVGAPTMGAAGVNYVAMNPGISGTSITKIQAAGVDTNVAMELTSKGSGSHLLATGGGTQFRVDHTAGSVDFIGVTGSSAGFPVMIPSGASTNISFIHGTKGSGEHIFSTSGTGNSQMRISHTASAVNYAQITGSATGGPISLSAAGSDTNIDLALFAKGAGRVRFGTLTVNADAPITGYIEIRDNGGTLRKLAVIA